VLSLKYPYVTDYKNNEALRKSFNELTEKTFSFNFIKWFNNGFWGEKYIPCSLVDGEKVVANVSVNLMDFILDGTEKHYIQIGTVMTDEGYRGLGLSRCLMERVIAQYKQKVDGIYLFGNDSVADFYPRFGFTKGMEYQYSKKTNMKNVKEHIVHVNIVDQLSRQRFLDTIKNNAGNSRFSMDNFGLTSFWTMGPLSDSIYYYADEDAYIIADVEGENLNLYEIISAVRVDLEKIISSFGSTISKVTLGFTPYDTDGYDMEELHEEDCTFFYLGKDLENIEKKRLMFPVLSHA
jgi:GNAT superfamily N-acetyltransferase